MKSLEHSSTMLNISLQTKKKKQRYFVFVSVKINLNGIQGWFGNVELVERKECRYASSIGCRRRREKQTFDDNECSETQTRNKPSRRERRQCSTATARRQETQTRRRRINLSSSQNSTQLEECLMIIFWLVEHRWFVVLLERYSLFYIDIDLQTSE